MKVDKLTMELLLAVGILLFTAWMCNAASTQIQFTYKPEDENHRYYLFKDTNKLTWYEADSNCKGQGYSLVSIPDQATQGVIENLLISASGISDINSTGIWTGGKVSNDMVWRTLNLSAFQGVVRSQNIGINNFAEIKMMQTGTKLELVAQAYNYIRNPLCQERNSGGCSNALVFGDLCYKQLADRVTWYSAVKLCEQYGATLAYTDLHRQDFIDTFTDIIGVNDELWTGIYRRPWFWNKQYEYKEEWIMRYFNWAPGPVNQGRSSEPHCIFIRGDQGYLWGTQNCATANTDYHYQYFICEKDPSVPGTTPTTTTTTTATTETTTTTAAPVTPSTLAGESSTGNDDTDTDTSSISDIANVTPTVDTGKVDGLSQANIVIIAVVVALVVIIILVVIVVVLVIRRKAQQKTSENIDLKDRSNDQVNANGTDNFAQNIHDPDSIDDIIEPAYSTSGHHLSSDNKADSKVAHNGEKNDTYASVDNEKSANTKPKKEKEVKKQEEKNNKDKKGQKKNKDKKENKPKKSDISEDTGVLYADVDRSNLSPKESNPGTTSSDNPEDLYADMPQVPTKNFDSSDGRGSPNGEDVMVDNQFYMSKETNQNDAPDLYAEVDETG